MFSLCQSRRGTVLERERSPRTSCGFCQIRCPCHLGICFSLYCVHVTCHCCFICHFATISKMTFFGAAPEDNRLFCVPTHRICHTSSLSSSGSALHGQDRVISLAKLSLFLCLLYFLSCLTMRVHCIRCHSGSSGHSSLKPSSVVVKRAETLRVSLHLLLL